MLEPSATIVASNFYAVSNLITIPPITLLLPPKLSQRFQRAIQRLVEWIVHEEAPLHLPDVLLKFEERIPIQVAELIS